MAFRRFLVSALIAFCVVISCCCASAQGPEPKNVPAQPAAGQAEAITPIVNQHALDVLKHMSDTLGKSKSMSFRARSLVPIKGPNNMWIILFGDSHVVMQKPDKLFAQTRGDVFHYDFYFDGNKITAYAPAKNVYAIKDAPGTVDAMIAEIDKKGENAFPYADILTSDSYDELTGGMVNAIYVGRSIIDGVKTDHLAFSCKGVEWQIWIGIEDYLPRLVNATYLDDVAEPSYTVEFSDWQLNIPAAPETFKYQNTSEAAQVEFKKPGALSKP